MNELERLREQVARLDGLSAAQHETIGAQGQEIERLRGVVDVLANGLAKHCGMTQRQTIRWAEKLEASGEGE